MTDEEAEIELEVLPTLEETDRFWSLIEDAWATQSDDAKAARAALIARQPGEELDDQVAIVDDALDGVMDNLRAVFEFEGCPQSELVAMDRVLERALYAIDRSDIQAVTDGSDDGFLYARGFIVAMGKAFYSAVLLDPAMAICDAECETMCYLPAHIHSDRFGGSFPETGSQISRESGNNGDGWAAAE